MPKGKMRLAGNRLDNPVLVSSCTFMYTPVLCSVLSGAFSSLSAFFAFAAGNCFDDVVFTGFSLQNEF